MSTDLVTLFQTLENLKRTKRTGWLDRGVPREDVESVADHSLMTALIAWITARQDDALDADRVLKLAIVHDFAEAIVGDRPPYEPHEIPSADDPDALLAFFSVRHLRTPENAAEKRHDENAAAGHLVSLMPKRAGYEIAALWAEYEAQDTPEARLVKQVDVLDAFLQSLSYRASHPDVPVWGFTDMAMKEIDHPALVAIRDAALSED